MTIQASHWLRHWGDTKHPPVRRERTCAVVQGTGEKEGGGGEKVE